nr:hypothetical protein [Tanacetum cinerariifolium]
EAKVEEHHGNLLLSKNNKHISSACKNSKIDSQDVISKVVCAMCKKCLISVNHDKCLSKNVHGKNSCGKNQKVKVSVKEIQKKYQPKVAKQKTNQKVKVSVKEIQKKYQPKVANQKTVGTRESLATPKPRKPRLLLRWSPTGRLFDQEGKLVDSSESKSKSNGDNACTSNTMEPKIKQFPNSTSLLDRLFRFVYEIAKTDEQDDAERGRDDDEETESDEESDGDETREEEGRGLQLSQDVKDSHVTLTSVHPDGQQESSSVSSQFVTSMLYPTSDAGMESIFATASSPVAPLQTSRPIMTPSTIATITTISHAPIPPTIIPSDVLQNLPTFDSMFHFEDRLKSLEANFLEYIQINPFAEAVSNILGIVHQYMNQQMNEAVRVEVQIQIDRLCDSYQKENDEFLRTIDDNMKTRLKVKSTNKFQRSYQELNKMEQKKILIEKMEGNKSIQRSDEQRNLYKALMEAYEADKIILDTYGERVILKRRRDDDDDQGERPSAGSDQGSKRQGEGKKPESASAPLQTATRSAGRSTSGSKSRQASA